MVWWQANRERRGVFTWLARKESREEDWRWGRSTVIYRACKKKRTQKTWGEIIAINIIEDETAGFNGVVIRRSKEGEEERSRCAWGNMVLLLGRWAAGRGGARAQPKANRRRALASSWAPGGSVLVVAAASGWAWRTGICPACAFLWLHPEKKGLNVGPTWHRNDKIMKRAAAKKIPESWGPLAIEKREIAAGSWAGIAGS